MQLEEASIRVDKRVEDGVWTLWEERPAVEVWQGRGRGALTLRPLNVTSGVKCL